MPRWPSPQARIEDRIAPCPATGCWLWTGEIATDGRYGQISSNGKKKRAHRVAWELAYGPIRPGLLVLHRCDVESCVNPAHLWLGTHAENMADRNNKGRTASGERVKNTARFTPEKVRAIRARVGSGESQSAIARELGVKPSSIWQIVRRRTWKHID